MIKIVSTLILNYITHTNLKVNKELNDDLSASVYIKRHELEQQLKSRLMLVKQNLKLEIIRAEYALEIAKSAKIERPLENLNIKELFPIDLGSDGISAKIEVLKSIDNLWELDQNIEIIANKLALFSNAPPKVDNLQAINFLELPEIPLHTDNVNRSLIVISALMLGVFLGMFIVLLTTTISFENEA